MTKKTQNNRISIFLSEEIRQRLDEYCENWAEGTLSNNRSAIMADLIKKYIPRVIVD